MARGDRRPARAAERAAPSLEVPVEVALDSPYVLLVLCTEHLRTSEEIAYRLREHQVRFGVTRWTVFGDRPDLQPAEALVPVLDLIA